MSEPSRHATARADQITRTYCRAELLRPRVGRSPAHRSGSIEPDRYQNRSSRRLQTCPFAASWEANIGWVRDQLVNGYAASERADEPAGDGDRQRGRSDQAEVDGAGHAIDLSGARRLAAENRVHAGSPPRHADESVTGSGVNRSAPQGGRGGSSAKGLWRRPVPLSRREKILLYDFAWQPGVYSKGQKGEDFRRFPRRLNFREAFSNAGRTGNLWQPRLRRAAHASIRR